MKQFLIASVLLLSSMFTLSADELVIQNQLPTLPEILEQKGNVYGTFGLNAGILPNFNASIGYQSGHFGIDLQSNLILLVLPVDVSSHVKVSTLGKKGNFYTGAGPFFSTFLGFGGEIIGGYRSTPKSGLGFYVEAFGRPVYQDRQVSYAKDMVAEVESEDRSLSNGALISTILGSGIAGLRAGIAF